MSVSTSSSLSSSPDSSGSISPLLSSVKGVLRTSPPSPLRLSQEEKELYGSMDSVLVSEYYDPDSESYRECRKTYKAPWQVSRDNMIFVATANLTVEEVREALTLALTGAGYTHPLPTFHVNIPFYSEKDPVTGKKERKSTGNGYVWVDDLVVARRLVGKDSQGELQYTPKPWSPEPPQIQEIARTAVNMMSKHIHDPSFEDLEDTQVLYALLRRIDEAFGEEYSGEYSRLVHSFDSNTIEDFEEWYEYSIVAGYLNERWKDLRSVFEYSYLDPGEKTLKESDIVVLNPRTQERLRLEPSYAYRHNNDTYTHIIQTQYSGRNPEGTLRKLLTLMERYCESTSGHPYGFYRDCFPGKKDSNPKRSPMYTLFLVFDPEGTDAYFVTQMQKVTVLRDPAISLLFLYTSRSDLKEQEIPSLEKGQVGVFAENRLTQKGNRNRNSSKSTHGRNIDKSEYKDKECPKVHRRYIVGSSSSHLGNKSEREDSSESVRKESKKRGRGGRSKGSDRERMLSSQW